MRRFPLYQLTSQRLPPEYPTFPGAASGNVLRNESIFPAKSAKRLEPRDTTKVVGGKSLPREPWITTAAAAAGGAATAAASRSASYLSSSNNSLFVDPRQYQKGLPLPAFATHHPSTSSLSAMRHAFSNSSDAGLIDDRQYTRWYPAAEDVVYHATKVLGFPSPTGRLTPLMMSVSQSGSEYHCGEETPTFPCDEQPLPASRFIDPRSVVNDMHPKKKRTRRGHRGGKNRRRFQQKKSQDGLDCLSNTDTAGLAIQAALECLLNSEDQQLQSPSIDWQESSSLSQTTPDSLKDLPQSVVLDLLTRLLLPDCNTLSSRTPQSISPRDSW